MKLNSRIFISRYPRGKTGLRFFFPTLLHSLLFITCGVPLTQWWWQKWPWGWPEISSGAEMRRGGEEAVIHYVHIKSRKSKSNCALRWQPKRNVVDLNNIEDFNTSAHIILYYHCRLTSLSKNHFCKMSDFECSEIYTCTFFFFFFWL